MAAVLTSDMDNTDKIINLLQDCKQLKLQVQHPCIESSDYGFTVKNDNTIVYGLGCIKGEGEAAVLTLQAYRKKHGKIGSLTNLMSCLQAEGKLNKKLIEALCYGGAFDVWGLERATIIASIEATTKFVQQQHAQKASGQGNLFGASVAEFTYKPARSWTLTQTLDHEKAVLGYYASGHPLDAMQTELF